MNILIVDDSEYMRSQINDALTDAGYNVVGQAETGEQAIDMALDLKPDLITLDFILPDMIGTYVLKVLKGKEKIDSHIIIVSGVAKQSAIDHGMEAGAADYIVKPFTTQCIVDSIQKLTAVHVK